MNPISRTWIILIIKFKNDEKYATCCGVGTSFSE